ncbi:plant-specific transcription factor YABBY family protein [Wolffia australiana]
MDPASASPPEHLCYVRCNFCNTVLAVGVPCKRLMETVTVKCGHCSNLSFLSTRPLVNAHCADLHMALGLGIQGSLNDHKRLPLSMSSASASTQEPKEPYVVKPPERKHRVPSAYNRFMKEEIQRIKAAHPNIPHREAFSMASKNWAKNDLQTNGKITDERSKKLKVAHYHHMIQGRGNGVMGDGFDAFKKLERRI